MRSPSFIISSLDLGANHMTWQSLVLLKAFCICSQVLEDIVGDRLINKRGLQLATYNCIRLYIYVCMYVCIYIYIHVCMYIISIN